MLNEWQFITFKQGGNKTGRSHFEKPKISLSSTDEIMALFFFCFITEESEFCIKIGYKSVCPLAALILFHKVWIMIT